MTDIAISVKHLTKVYKLYNQPIDRLKEALNPFKKNYHKDFYALNDVSFEIKKGETVGIIGKNGAGKSTLLKIITGVLTPSSGSVQVNGKIASLLELGAGFNPDYTGLENIYFQGSLMGYTREEMESKIDDILTFADIGEFIHQPVKTYSSGMFARLAFSVAINVEPDILIVDEALSVGDFAFQYKCFQKFKDFQANNKTILFVTHGMQEVVRYCSRAIFISNGILLEDSYNTQEVVFNYEKLVRGEGKSYQQEISSDEHRFGTHQAKMTDVCFEQSIAVNDQLSPNEGDDSIAVLTVGLPTKIKILVDAYEDLDRLALGFSLKNVKGVVVWGDCSLAEGENYFSFVKGKHEIEIDFNANLVGGEYYFYIGLSSFQEHKIDIDQRWRVRKVKFISKRTMCEGQVYAPSRITIKGDV